MTGLRTILNAIRAPRRYARIASARLQMKTEVPLRMRSAFYLQAQMDIHPRSAWHSPEFIRATGGFFPKDDATDRRICDLEPWDNVRRDMLVLLLRTVLERGVEGDLGELGVWKGSTARLMHHYAPERRLHLFDTFSGFDERDIAAERTTTGQEVDEGLFADTSVKAVIRFIAPRNGNVSCHPGFFPDSIPADFGDERFALVSLDADLYEPILAGLRYFYPRVTSGGFIVVHDYNTWRGARKAVNDFFADKTECPVPMPDKSGSVVIAKL